MEDDLAQEISNKLGKKIVQRMGPNKTLSSISKVCKVVNGIKEIQESYDRSAGFHKLSVQHSTRDALQDEKEMIQDLINIQPFQHCQGRCHNSFPEIIRSPLRYLNIVEHHQWLERHKQELDIN